MISIDEKVIRKAQEGDMEAARELVDRSYGAIYGFLRRLCRQPADAEDLTQKTYARLWPALSGFEGRSSVSSWMHGIAYHVFQDWQRSNQRTESRCDDWWRECPDNAATPDRQVIDQDLRATLWAVVESLTPDLRTTIYLHYSQGLTLEETAQVMEVASSTVKYRLRNALHFLQSRMNESTSPGQRKIIPSSTL